MDYDSSLTQLHSEDFMMDNETYVKLQHRHMPAIELLKNLVEVRNPPARQMIQKFPLFYVEKTMRGHDKPLFEHEKIERKVYKNIFGKKLNWSYSKLSNKLSGFFDDLASKTRQIAQACIYLQEQGQLTSKHVDSLICVLSHLTPPERIYIITHNLGLFRDLHHLNRLLTVDGTS